MRNRSFPSPVVGFVIILTGLLLPASGARVRPAMAAMLSDQTGPVPIQAAGRGNPYINFRDGRPILVTFSGAAGLSSAMSDPATKGLALASADFDEDGMPDLVASYQSSDGGLLSLHFGNVDAVYPNAPEAKERRAKGTFVDAPFLPDAKLFETPERPDFLGAGDFDADGHWDVVAARDGGSSLTLHRGDGAGGLRPSESLPLPGAVTAMATGDVNRRDGLEDVLVGVVTPSGAQLLVFEWPEGALKGDPEVIALPEPAMDLAVGQLDAEFPIDVAVAAGKYLAIVEGRDRRLTHREDRRAMVGQARTARHALPSFVHRIALADVDADGTVELAMLAEGGELRIARVADLESFSTSPGDPLAQVSPQEAADAFLVAGRLSSTPGVALALANRTGREIRILSPAPAGSAFQATILSTLNPAADVLPMRLNSDALADLVVLSQTASFLASLETLPLATFTVTNTLDSGSGSLRAAIQAANSTAGADIVAFSIPGTGPHTIQLLARLPLITESLTIDATTEPDFTGTPVVSLDGIMILTGHQGLFVDTPSGASMIRGLEIIRFGRGIFMTNAGGNIVEGNHVGTTGANREYGVHTELTTGDTIGGTTSAARNVVSGNVGFGISLALSSEGRVLGNYVGTNVSGSFALPNGSTAIDVIDSSNTSIGAATGGAGNLVSGNIREGIRLFDALGTLIQGNLVGTNSVGSSALPNGLAGIFVDLENATIGGTTPAARNLISGNSGAGILLFPGNTSLVQGNLIGTGLSGVTAIPNVTGVELIGTEDALIGGSIAGARNVISGNTEKGIVIYQGTGNDVLSNFIGTSTNGLFPLGNEVGILLNSADDNRIGGSSLATANVISANNGGVVLLSESTGNLVEVNLIGTNLAGGFSSLMRNVEFGITIDYSTNNLVGVKQGQGNIIAGSSIGLHIKGGSSLNRIQGNRIGTDLTGTVPAPNTDGVVIEEYAHGNIIGGIYAETGNLISGNSNTGVVIRGSAMENDFLGNLIGTDITGNVAMGSAFGVSISESARMNTIGGPDPKDRNLISGNVNNLVHLGIPGRRSDNLIEGNYLGTDASGNMPLGSGASNVAVLSTGVVRFVGNIIGGNYSRGIRVSGSEFVDILGNRIGVGASMSSIGLSGPGILLDGSTDSYVIENIIANNAGDGVEVIGTGTGIAIFENSIHSNGGLGIDLGSDGVTPNDLGDGDTGPNGLQNFPVVTTALATGGNVTVAGSLNGTPSEYFFVDFYANTSCDPSGHGEGEIFLGSITVFTDVTGNVSFAGDLVGPVGGGAVVTATAMDNTGFSSSEFSACFTATGVPPPAPTAVEFTSPVDVTWEAVPGAIAYHLYAGTPGILPRLATSAADSCYAGAVQSTGLMIPPASDPPPGSMFWILVTAEGPYGESPMGPSSNGPRQQDSFGDCSDSCSHSPCEAGGPLDPACAFSAGIVCEKDADCCTQLWTADCVQKVQTVFRSLNCPASQGNCSHTLCDQGAPLMMGCDVPPLPSSCTSAICSVDAHCCQQAWDDACIAQVGSVCGYNCL